MKRNIDTTESKLRDRPEVDQLRVDFDTAEEDVVFRALCDELRDDLDEFVEGLGGGLDIKHVQNVGFGVEVTIR